MIHSKDFLADVFLKWELDIDECKITEDDFFCFIDTLIFNAFPKRASIESTAFLILGIE